MPSLPPTPLHQDASAPSRARTPRGLYVIVALFLVLGVTYSVVNPILEASDELWHYPFVQHLADGGSLPVQRPGEVGPWRQEGSQPPLYYALGALLTRWIDTSDLDEVRRLNPHADMGVPTADRNVNMIVHTPRERFPYRGTVLAVQVVRWLSVLMGAVTVVAAYLLAREVFPEDDAVALGTAAFTAFNAMYLFVTASVNNDALVIMLSALAVWRLVAAVRRAPTSAGWAAIGVLIGLAALSKASALGLLGLAGLVVAYDTWRAARAGQTGTLRRLLLSSAPVGVPVLAIAGWWYARNWVLYRDPLGFNAFVAVVGARHPVPTLGQLAAEWRGFVMSYWGFFGGMNVPAPEWVYVLLSALGALGLLAAPLYVWRRQRAGLLGRDGWVQVGLVGLWPLVVFLALVRWTLLTIASQGRLMFSALTALSLLMAMGLAALLPRRPRLLPAAAGGALLAIAALLPFITIRPAYAPPRILQPEEVSPALQERLDVRFGEGIRLLGYDVDRQEALPGEQVAITLYWECLAPMQADYSIFLHLLDPNEVTIAQRDVYPGQGTYATSLWSPGEILADTLVLTLPETALTPLEARYEVGFYLLSTGERLPAFAAGGEALGDNVRFGALSIPRQVAEGLPNPVRLHLEDGVTLVGYDLDRTAARPGEALHLTLYWRARDAVSDNYSVFTQVVGEAHSIWAQQDGWPLGGNAPTSAWQPGQVVEDPYTLLVKEEAPPGVYVLQVGMYDASGRRLSLLGEGGHVRDNRIVLGHVRVLPAE